MDCQIWKKIVSQIYGYFTWNLVEIRSEEMSFENDENETNLKGLAVEPQYTDALCISGIWDLDLHKKITNNSTQKFQVFEVLDLENKVT